MAEVVMQIGGAKPSLKPMSCGYPIKSDMIEVLPSSTQLMEQKKLVRTLCWPPSICADCLSPRCSRFKNKQIKGRTRTKPMTT